MSAQQEIEQVHRPSARFDAFDGGAVNQHAADERLLAHKQPTLDKRCDRKLNLLKDRNQKTEIVQSLSSCCTNDQQQQQQPGRLITDGPAMDNQKSPTTAAPIVSSVASSEADADGARPGASGLPDEQQQPKLLDEIKCSAVHTLERDMPDFDYSHLVRELQDRILKDFQLNVGLYAQRDIEKCKQDTWFVERFLLRQKLDLDKAFDMLKRTMRFKNESLARSIRREDFPAEFYQVGGLFCYEEDRKGNKMLYIRLKVHRKIPEIQLVLQAFLYYNIDYLDELANGRGIAIVLDCTGAGLANADMDMLFFLISTLVNYFPKAMSYLLVHELPWILKPFWHIAKAWLAEEHRQLIKFSNSRTIYEYVTRENLPDFMGGTCERSYTTPPENCTTLEQACKLWGVEPEVAKRILLKFAQYLPAETVAKCENITMADDDDHYVDTSEDQRPGENANNKSSNGCIASQDEFDSDQENTRQQLSGR